MIKLNTFDNRKDVDYHVAPSFDINLQLFAEGEGQESPEAQSESIADISAKAQDFFNAAMNPEKPAEAEGQATDNQVDSTEQIKVREETPPELILGKFKSYEELEKAYSNLEGFNTQTRQELSSIKQMLEQRQIEEKPPEVSPEEVDEEELAARKEAFLNRFYDNPMEVIEELNKKAETRAEEIAKQMVAPIFKEKEEVRKQQEWNSKAMQFKEQHPDMMQYSDKMVSFLESNPEIADKDNAFELAYNYSKGVSSNATPDEMLKDPEFIKKIMGDENIRNELLKAAAENSRKGNPPSLISSGIATGGKAVASPPQEPKTFKEAGQMFIKSLGIGG